MNRQRFRGRGTDWSLAAWLLTDERAAYMTGQAIVADGGEILV